MVEVEVTVADTTRVHGLMRRLRHLFDSEAVIYDPVGKTVRVRAEWESRTVVAVVEAVQAWMNESGAASATLAIGNRSFTLVSPDVSRSDVESETGALALITEVVRSAHGAQDSVALLTRACEIISHAFGFERAGIAHSGSATGVTEVVASYGWSLGELMTVAGLPDVQSILRDAAESASVVATKTAGGSSLDALAVVPLMNADGCDGFLLADLGGGDAMTLAASDRVLLSTLGTIISALLEQTVAHDDLQLAGEFKSDFIALASHELRTPTAAVCGIATTLHQRGDILTAEQRRDMCQVLYEQGLRLHRLVDQLLDLSRLEGASLRISPSSLAVLERTEEIVRSVAGERRDEIEIRIDPALIMDADGVAFDRIVSNLIINALRYGQAPIAVSASARDRHFRLTVEDSGPGVPHDLQPQLFERFTRGDNVTKSGAGLGLSIARSYAHAHGGELLYANGTPHGARFELVVPIVP
jgi:signal transduction histidine kinase